MVIDQFLLYEIITRNKINGRITIKFGDRLGDRAAARRSSLMINGY